MAVNQDIIDAIITRLKNIKVGNGYSFDVGTVEKPNRDGDQWNPQVRDIYVEIEMEEENPEYFCPGNPPRIGWDMTVSITGYCKRLDVDSRHDQPENPKRSVAESVMSAAIQKAIANGDAGGWHTFGSKAKDAHFAKKQQMDEPGFDVANVSLVISYRTSELDAATVG